MKRFLVLLIAVNSVLIVFGQSRDTLLQRLATAKEDTNKVNLLNAISFRYAWSDADTSIMYAQHAVDLAQKINMEKGIADAQLNMCAAFTTLGNYSRALDNAFKSLVFYEKTNDGQNLQFTNQLIAGCYRDLGDYNNSLVYFNKALKLAGKDTGAIAMVSGLIGSVYQRNNQPDSAILFLKKSYEILSNRTFVNVELGNSYAKKGNYDSAMYYYRKAIPLALQNHTEVDLIDIYSGIAQLYKAKSNLDSAAWYAKKALDEKSGKTYPIGLLHAATILTDLYESENKQDSAFKYIKISISLKDSLFNREKTIAFQNLAFKEQEKQKEIEASKLQYENRLKMYSLLGILLMVLSIAVILFRNNRQRQKAFALLQKQKEQIDLQKAKAEQALEDLRVTQAQLIQSEKMASLGEVTAGIAHEIQNPLNFVNNFSEVNKELLGELKEEADKGNIDEVKSIANDVIENSEKINHHGKRADAIVKGMLQHSRSSTGVKEPTDINALADEYLRLSYHGLRAKDKEFNAIMKTNFDQSIATINIIPQDIGRVLLNLYNNAFYAVNEKKKQQHEGYGPEVSVSTKKINDKVVLTLKDNGNGIPQKVVDKIFQPFFTTKPTGSGTGLGLSLSYNIVKAHGGEIKVNTVEGEFTEFVIQLPISV
ncbi:MAG TPA: ATP-binding protein [Hanamia sp.]|nr:ATP-binding protein [Hanamia sp.]